MDLAALKERLGDQYEALETYVSTLIGQRDAAKNEAYTRRKTLQAEVQSLREQKAKLYERLGLDEDADLDALPDVKGQAEAAKQVEIRVKQLEKKLVDSGQAFGDLDRRYRDALLDRELQKALGGRDFVDRDLVESYIRGRLEWQDDAIKYRHGDNQRVDLAEGVDLLVKDKPALLKQAPAGGSGWNPAAKSNGAGVPDAAASRQKLMAQVSTGDPAAGP